MNDKLAKFTVWLLIVLFALIIISPVWVRLV